MFRSLSICWIRSIFLIECRTVVWCLPPNWRPISGGEASVRCFAMYMAIWRGYTIARALFFALSSTRPWIDSIVILRACESMKFLSTCCAYGRVMSAPIGGLLLFRHVAISALEAFTDIVKKARECLKNGANRYKRNTTNSCPPIPATCTGPQDYIATKTCPTSPRRIGCGAILSIRL